MLLARVFCVNCLDFIFVGNIYIIALVRLYAGLRIGFSARSVGWWPTRNF